MPDYATMYGDLRGRVTAVIRSTEPSALAAFAPAAPEWRVRDLAAHLGGVCADVVSGNIDGVATDAWSAAQVDARRDRTIEQLLDEWDEMGRSVEAVIRQFPEVPAWEMFIADAVTHEHDIRGAVGRPGARDSEALIAMSHAAIAGIGARLEREQLGTLTVVLDDDAPNTVAAGPAEKSLHITRFEFVRSLTGRRSVPQITAYRWEGAPEPDWVVLDIFTPRATPLFE